MLLLNIRRACIYYIPLFKINSKFVVLIWINFLFTIGPENADNLFDKYLCIEQMF